MSEPTPPVASDPEREAREILESSDRLDVERAVVAGDYVRYDETARQALKELRQRLVAALGAQSHRPVSFLVWGAPGSGKSFLVREITASLESPVELVELNLAQLEEGDFRGQLGRLRDRPGDVVCFVDEVDAKSGESWPYELLLPVLEPAVVPPHRTAFILVGSGGRDRTEFIEHLRARPKGVDLLSRVPRGNEFTVPPLGVGDRILVAALQLVESAREEGREIREVERLALYYIATHPALGSARQLRSFALQCAARIPRGEDRVRYDHLFAAGDPENKAFWSHAGDARERLADRFVSVVAPGPHRSLPVVPAASPRGPSGGRSESRRLAILPFLNISPDPADAYFADGLTEELIATVSRVGRLHVIARTSVMRYRAGPKSAAETARELNVEVLLEGSVRKAGDQLRVTAQLIDVGSEETLWSSTYDRRLAAVFELQQELASRIADSLQVRLLAGEQAQLDRPPTTNLDAYGHYLKGRQLWWVGGSAAIRSALEEFRQALALDPKFALAYCGVAESEMLLGNRGYELLTKAIVRAEAAAQEALRLDPNLAEAHVALSPILYNRYDWGGCERELDRALALDPSNVLAHYWRAIAVGVQRRPADGLANAQKAVDLDPLVPRRKVVLAQQYYWLRDYPRALAVLAEPGVLETIPQYHLYPMCLLLSGRTAEAIAAAEGVLARGIDVPTNSGSLAVIYACSGRADEARAILRTLHGLAAQQHVPAGVLGEVYAALGENDAAFEWFRRAFDERSALIVEDLAIDPFFDRLRQDPRFESLLALFNFPPTPRSS